MDYGNGNCRHKQYTKRLDLFLRQKIRSINTVQYDTQQTMRMDIIDTKCPEFGINVFDTLNILGCKSTSNFRRPYSLQKSNKYGIKHSPARYIN